MSVRRLSRVPISVVCATFAMIVSACGSDPAAPPECIVSNVDLIAPVRTILPGGSTTLQVAVTQTNCSFAPAPTFSSSASNIATVNQGGTVTGVLPGNVVIRVVAAGLTDTVNMTVAPTPVSTIDVNAGTGSVIVGRTLALVATTKDAQGATLTGRTVTWSSAATSVATVSASGLVTGVTAGSANITATSEGRTATVTITVAPVPVNTVVVSVPNVTMALNSSQQATAVASDAAGNVLAGRVITWSSSNPAVGIVSSSGLVGTVAPGVVIITATSEGKTGVVSITVSPLPVSTVVVTVPNLIMAINASQQATAVARDASGNVLAGRAVTWSTSNAAVGIVTGSGLVTAIAPGAMAITATIDGVAGLVAISVPAPPAPTVSALTPLNVDEVFSMVPIAITGTNFQIGATSVAFTGAGITTGALVVQSATAMSVPLLIAGGLGDRTSNMTVTTFGGTTAVRQLNVFAVGSGALQTANTIGGVGGATAYTLDCAVGSVATGFNARAGAFLDQIGLRCQPVTGAARTFGAMAPTNVVGGSGGVPFVVSCNAGSVMTGMSGTYTGPFALNIVTISAICTPTNGGATQTTTAAGGAPGAQAFSVSCPLGLVMTGIQGAYGAVVDRVQPRCR